MTLVYALGRARGALRADLRRVYGLDLDRLLADRGIRPMVLADLTMYLPDGSMLWRVLDTPRAWSVESHLLATIIDLTMLRMWGDADRRRRGPRPMPVKRPGDAKATPAHPVERSGQDSDGGEEPGRRTRTRRIRAHAIPIDQLDRFMSRGFHDVRRRESRPGMAS